MFSSQACPQFFQTVTISPRRRIRRNADQFANVVESQALPYFEDDHLALRGRQFGQTAHRRDFRLRLARGPFEPPPRLQFAGEPPPERPAIIERAIPERPEAIPLRLLRLDRKSQQRNKRLLHHIFGLAMRKTECAAIEY